MMKHGLEMVRGQRARRQRQAAEFQCPASPPRARGDPCPGTPLQYFTSLFPPLVILPLSLCFPLSIVSALRKRLARRRRTRCPRLQCSRRYSAGRPGAMHLSPRRPRTSSDGTITPRSRSLCSWLLPPMQRPHRLAKRLKHQ
jgi:hypothetical protein